MQMFAEDAPMETAAKKAGDLVLLKQSVDMMFPRQQPDSEDVEKVQKFIIEAINPETSKVDKYVVRPTIGRVYGGTKLGITEFEIRGERGRLIGRIDPSQLKIGRDELKPDFAYLILSSKSKKEQYFDRLKAGLSRHVVENYITNYNKWKSLGVPESLQFFHRYEE